MLYIWKTHETTVFIMFLFTFDEFTMAIFTA